MAATTTPSEESWAGEDVTIAEIERELARLRMVSAGEGQQPNLRTSVMTHLAWVPQPWLGAAEETLMGMAERHPSRTLILVPDPDAENGLDARVAVRCFPIGERAICGEVVELVLRGNRSQAPASIVLPLVIADLPVFCRWRGEPPFGGIEFEQMVDVTDRLIVDSAEWDELRYEELSAVFGRVAASDIAWARTEAWRSQLARYWPGIREQEIRIRGPRAEGELLRGWLNARLDRAIRPVEPARELAVRLGGEDLQLQRFRMPSPSDLLSAELDRFTRDAVYEEAVLAAVAALG
jgi:hypothetical protein